MRTHRQVALLFLRVSLVLVCGTAAAWAHGGGLDHCGGHHDRKRGGYHVHDWARYRACHPEQGAATSQTLTPKSAEVEAESPVRSTADAEQTVYVTRTGTKYHSAGCRYLARSAIPMSLKDAARCYGACSVCSPPTLQDHAEAPGVSPPTDSSDETVSTETRVPATARQCAAITQKGTRCKRTTKSGGRYCWQHDR